MGFGELYNLACKGSLMIRFIRFLISPNRLERFFRERSEQELILAPLLYLLALRAEEED